MTDTTTADSEPDQPLGLALTDQLGLVPERTMVYKVDTADMEVRLVEGGPWPNTDSEGDTCYENTHFKTHREALTKLAAEGTAWLSLNARERARLKARLLELVDEDRKAQAGVDRAWKGLRA